MKQLLVIMFILLLAGLILAQWLSSTEQKSNLPWDINTTETGATEVFNLDVGEIDLKTMMHRLHKIAEVNIFEKKDEKAVLEAYFSKSKLGIFDAVLIAELDIKSAELHTFIQALKRGDREATPSGQWKYQLSESMMQKANGLRVWRLVYIPVVKYDDQSLTKQFGEPTETEVLNEQLSYWYYPNKGLIVLYDKDGSEIFYYVAKNEFARLKAALPKDKQAIKRK